MNQMQDLTLDNLKTDLARFNTNADPKTYIAQAGSMLSAARAMLIRSDALHRAKRNNELVKMKDQLDHMDAEHGKVVHDLVTIIAKLEALRA